PVAVAVEDAGGNTVTGDSSTVTLTLSSGTFASGSNTATATAVHGIATFGGLVINTPGTYTPAPRHPPLNRPPPHALPNTTGTSVYDDFNSAATDFTSNFRVVTTAAPTTPAWPGAPGSACWT